MATARARIELTHCVRALLAVLALIAQLAVGSLVLPDVASAQAVTRLDAVTILCAGAPAHDASPHRHRRPDGSTLCPLDIAQTLQGALLLPASATVPPRTLLAWRRRDAMPPARGPPARLAWSLHVRGPPHLV